MSKDWEEGGGFTAEQIADAALVLTDLACAEGEYLIRKEATEAEEESLRELLHETLGRWRAVPVALRIEALRQAREEAMRQRSARCIVDTTVGNGLADSQRRLVALHGWIYTVQLPSLAELGTMFQATVRESRRYARFCGEPFADPQSTLNATLLWEMMMGEDGDSDALQRLLNQPSFVVRI